MRIYKVLREAEWRVLDAAGQSRGAAADLADGFVHFSTGAHLAETLRRHFAGEEGLWLLTCRAETLGAALRWEPSRGGDLFPHLYGPLRIADLEDARRLELDAAAEPLLPDEGGR